MSAQGDSEMEIDGPPSREDSTAEDPPRFGTVAWIQSNWDYERETASGDVLLVKFAREAPYMAVIPILAAFGVAATFFSVGATDLRVVESLFGTFGTGFVLFWRRWWCLTIADPDGRPRTNAARSQ